MKKIENLMSVIMILFVIMQNSAYSQDALPLANISPYDVKMGDVNDVSQRAIEFIVYDTSELISIIESNMSTYHYPGASICVVIDSNIVWQRSFGYADLENSVPVADTTLFYIASISKTFVANAVMQMWENGYLELDTDINNYLPFMVVNPHYPDSIITMRMLLSHTSSIITTSAMPGRIWGDDYPIPLGDVLENYLVAGGDYYNLNNYLTSPPGHTSQYSDCGMALAAYVVEFLAINNGMSLSFEEYCQDSLWGPLGMNETSWFQSNLDTSNIAVQYSYSGGYIRRGYSGSPIYPAGQLRTSAVQLGRHLRAFSRHGILNGNRILESETVDSMTTVQFPEVPTDNPFIKMGLGWLRFGDETTGWYHWGHNGSGIGGKSFMTFNPDDGAGIIALSNGAGAFDGIDNIAIALMGFAQDPDLDDIAAGYDNCPFDNNPGQEDSDGDGYGDACDQCPGYNDDLDSDGDTFADGCDNCPDEHNEDQSDIDTDGIGDICDNCPIVYNPDQEDSDLNGVGDYCQYICADGNEDGNINILDVTYLIACLYKDGPCPEPEWVSDVNGDSNTNILDITYLIAYLYKDGPEPDCF